MTEGWLSRPCAAPVGGIGRSLSMDHETGSDRADQSDHYGCLPPRLSWTSTDPAAGIGRQAGAVQMPASGAALALIPATAEPRGPRVRAVTIRQVGRPRVRG